MKFTAEELLIVNDTDFLLTKAKVTEKLNRLLENTREELLSFIQISDFNFPKELNLDYGKISKGENYNQLPFMILDFPSHFTKENIFAYRTMFWWGNFFSTTLHLQGNLLDIHRKNIYKNALKLFSKEIYICIGKTPWQYHYQEDNYILLTEENYHLIKEVPFLKLSSKIHVNNYNSLPNFSLSYFKLFLSIL